MNPAGPPRDPSDVLVVRHRWIFVAGIVFCVLVVVLEILVVVLHLRDTTPLGSTFWIGIATVIFVAAILIRAGRLRRSAVAQSQSRE